MKKLQTLRYYTKSGLRYGYQFETASIDGKRKWYVKKGFFTKREAEAAGTEAYNVYYRTGRVLSKPNISYSDFLDHWVEKGLVGFKKESTVDNYRKRIKNHIKPSLGMFYLKDVTREMIQDFIVELYHSGMSLNSIITIKGIITKSFNYAVVNKYLAYSPAVQIEIPTTIEPRIETKCEPHIIVSANIMEEIYKRFPFGSSAYIPLRLGYECGLRIGETFGLTWDCVDLEKKYILVNKQAQWYDDPTRTEEEKKKSNGSSECGGGHWYFTSPKYGSVRKIDISDDLVSILKKEKDRQTQAKEYYDEFYFNYYTDKDVVHTSPTRKSHIVFSTKITEYPVDLVCREECGKYTSSRIMQHASRMIRRDIIEGFDYHSLRHTHTTDLAERGFHDKYIQDRLGHKTLKTFKTVYEHLSDEMRQNESKRLNQIYNNGVISTPVK